jgi:hypothetical protein
MEKIYETDNRTIKINPDTDYWDFKKNQFKIYLTSKLISDIPTDPKIEDNNGLTWNCYLTQTKYECKIDCYICYFAKY